MWCELIRQLDANAELHSPATHEQIEAQERTLGVAFPADLKGLLLETNGAEVAHGLSLVWSAEEITTRNLEMRREWRRGGLLESYMPIDHMLFFGDRGNGDLFFFPITAIGVNDTILLWDHEDDSRISTAPSLVEWLQGRGH